MNPYDWQSHNPRIEIPRAKAAKVSKMLARGGSAVLLGGRGMGKSVYLQQLRSEFEKEGGLRVVIVPSPPPELTVRACLDRLASRLGVAQGLQDTRQIIDAYFAGDGVPERLVLLFDEFDRYAESGDRRSANPPGRGFFNDLEATRRDVAGLGMLATGSLGVFVVRDVLGSSFMSRALHVALQPFERADLATLARPFGERGEPLTETVEDALQLATGGIPALLTFGLQHLWERSQLPVERDVADVYSDFVEEHGDYLRDLTRSIADPRLSEAPLRVWDRIREAPGPLPRAELEKAHGPPKGPLDLDLTDVLRLLQAAGVVRIETALRTSDPVVAHPIAGIVNLPASTTPPADPRHHLVRDLDTLLARLHRSSADFFRPTDGKRLVPESVFAAHLALGFDLLGWQTEREAQSAAGRTDLKLRRNGIGETAVVEVKIWGRNDYRRAQEQIESYWTAEVAVGAVVQITDAKIPDWPETYRRECLSSDRVRVEPQPTIDSPIHARFACVSETPDGLTASVDHFLLRLPRRT